MRNFLRAYSHGKKQGSSVKCKWNTHINEHQRCHVSKRRLIDWSTPHACTKGIFATNYAKSCKNIVFLFLLILVLFILCKIVNIF
jgi:hypothetical protein